MKKFLTALGLVLLSQQALAVSSVVGIDFLGIAETVTSSVGDFVTNNNTPGAAVNSVADGNAAAYAYGLSNPSTVDVGFANAWDITSSNLTMLFVGSGVHKGQLSLTGGTIGGSSPHQFELIPFSDGVWQGYTGYNSVANNPETGVPTTYGIFALTVDLAAAFPGLSGDFNGVHLNMFDGGSSADAVVSLIGTTASTAAVPVPAALWLFGSGLLGLAGLKRKVV